MAYIGASPPATALTASDIADGIISEAKMANDAISLAELKAGTDGEIISWDASGNPVAIGAGTSGHFLKSAGAGAQPVFAAAGGGKIGQVVNTATTAVISSTSTSAATISGLTADITPAATSSKILVLVYLSGGATSNAHTTWQVFRDTTQIALGDADGSKTRATFGYRDPSGVMAYTANPWHISWVDSPSTTSQITYSMKWTTTTGTLYLNRTFDNTDNANYQRTPSCITLMEILA